MMKETNIHSQVTSTIAGDDGEAVAKSEQNVVIDDFRTDINAHLVAELYCIAYASFYIIYLYLKSIYDFLQNHC